MAKYEIWLDDPYGNRLQMLDSIERLSYIKTVNAQGYFTLRLPESFDADIVRKDLIVEIWRQPKSGSMALDFAGFVRAWRLLENPNATELSGPGINYLLSSRIIAYNAGSTEAMKTDQADDMMKDVFYENLIAGASDTSRDWSGYGLSVAADLTDGPSITLSFARDNVFDVLQKISEVSEGKGTDLYFDLVPTFGSDGMIDAEFRTAINQPGMDRTTSGGSPVYFGSKWGNLVDGELLYDYTDEVTYVYAGGQGEEEARMIDTAQDTTREAESPWGRREGWIDARNESSSDGVSAKAYQRLSEAAGVIEFSAKLLDTEQARYGTDWNLGDKVTCEFRGREFDALVRQVQVTIYNDGEESIIARVEA